MNGTTTRAPNNSLSQPRLSSETMMQDLPSFSFSLQHPHFSSSTPPFSTLGRSDHRDFTEKPKRMLNAYNFFFHHERLRLIEEATRNGTSAFFKGLTKHVADEWKALEEKDKEPYQKLADEDKLRFQAEVKIWKMKKNLTY